MKWIGQHIWDFISRFRNKVYLNYTLEEDNTNANALVVMADGEIRINNDLGGTGGETTHIRESIRNDEGITIPFGTPVYAIGEVGNSGVVRVGIAKANDPDKMPAIGITDGTYNNNSNGTMTLVGIYNTNISGFSSINPNDVIYVGVNGGLTSVKPTGRGSLIQNVGIVLKTNGSIIQGFQVACIGRTNDVPNLNSGEIFYGDASNQSVPTLLSSLTTSSAGSAIGAVQYSGAGGTFDAENSFKYTEATNTLSVSKLDTVNLLDLYTAADSTGSMQMTYDATKPSMLIKSDGHIQFRLNSVEATTPHESAFTIKNGADNIIWNIDESGNIKTLGTIKDDNNDDRLDLNDATKGTSISNAVASFSPGAANPSIRIYENTGNTDGSFYNEFTNSTLTANRTISLPDATGTLALSNENTTGSSGTVTSIGNLTGDVTSVNRATTIANGVVGTDKIADDAVTIDKLADSINSAIAANTAKDTNVSTNLTYTTASDRMTIVSSDGTNVVIAEASGSIAGVMSVAHHDKLDGIEDSATADQTKSDIDGLGITTVGALSSGTIASGFGNIDNGTSTLDTGLATVGDLHVSVAGQATLDLIDTGGQTYQIFARNSDDVFGLYDSTNTQTFLRYTGHATPASTKLALLEAGGNVGIGTTTPSKTLDVSGDITCTGNILPGITAVKILPSDFIADDGGRPLAIDDTGSDRWLESHSANPMFASVEIPAGFKATGVDVYGNGTSAVTVYEANINGRAVTSKGTGNIGTQINITDVTSNATNYLLIELVQTSGEQVNGGKVTIAKA